MLCFRIREKILYNISIHLFLTEYSTRNPVLTEMICSLKNSVVLVLCCYGLFSTTYMYKNFVPVVENSIFILPKKVFGLIFRGIEFYWIYSNRIKIEDFFWRIFSRSLQIFRSNRILYTFLTKYVDQRIIEFFWFF